MNLKWVRAKDGAIFGVCKGLARALDLPVGMVRLLWVLSVFCLGFGVLGYLMLAISLPREDKANPNQPMFLGVCTKLAQKTETEIGLVRFLMLFFLLSSFGLSLVAYVVLHFVLQDTQSSSRSPQTPP